ncbi:MAG: hypothetical protein NUW06_00905 [Candidatus Acetothermia bacterium]|jgi:hypothetical protein|nr:hypothetical protein [Candidatus Acetothermia bacterium]MDH7505681.1 hypothetical protein [Candidatus Acetothermia bacterium]
MAAGKVTLLILPGPEGKSEVERLVSGARAAIARDLIEKALQVKTIDEIIVATPAATFASELAGLPVVTELLDGADFHFGLRVWSLIEKHRIERLIYISGGSGALLSEEELATLAGLLLEEERLFLANNFYSTDFLALAPAQALLPLPPPESDNRLGWLLWEAGFKAAELPRTAATQFDIDTPTDLLILKIHPGAGPNTRAYLEGLDLGAAAARLDAALRAFTNREATVLVAGRVSAQTWRFLEEETACQAQVFSEERGLKASGREERGEGRSLLGFLLEELGPERFFRTLGKLADLALIDSRVLFAHLRKWPTAQDRFLSDLLRAEEIQDPEIREFTAAARAAPLPVILGGHSLVSGGLYALVELAWRGKSLERRVQVRPLSIPVRMNMKVKE